MPISGLDGEHRLPGVRSSNILRDRRGLMGNRVPQERYALGGGASYPTWWTSGETIFEGGVS